MTEATSLEPPRAEPAAPPSDAGGERLALRANKLELLERLADDLAHEIKNPLHSMVINLEVLKRRAGRADADSQEAVQRYLGVLSTELERVNRRIELLLRLSRPGRAAEPTSLDDLAAELLELIQLEARHHELEVDYLPNPAPVRVVVSREPARQAILNLVLETIDRLGPGGTLRIRSDQRDGWSRLAVGGADGPAWTPEGEAGCERLAAARALAAGFGGRVVTEPAGADGPALVLWLPVAGR